MSVIEEEHVSLAVKIVLTIAFLVVSYVGYELLPGILLLKREAVVNSHQYIESSRSKLSKIASEYRDAEVEIEKFKVADKDYSKIIDGLIAQKGVLKEEMKLEASKLPENEIPNQVITILEEE